MIDEYIYDEFSIINSAINKISKGTAIAGDYLVVSNDNQAAFYFAGVLLNSESLNLNLSVISGKNDKQHDIFKAWSNDKPSCNLYENFRDFLQGEPQVDMGNLVILYFSPVAGQMDINITGFLREIGCRLEHDNPPPKKPLLIVFSLLQGAYSKKLPDVASTENEFEALYKDAPEGCAGKQQLDLEKECRKYGDAMDIRIIRCSCLFGPYRQPFGASIIHNIIEQLISTKKIEYSLSDKKQVISTCYIRDAVLGIFYVLLKGSAGNAYNLSGYCKSIFSLKALIYDLVEDEGIDFCCKSTGDCLPNEYENIKLSTNKIKLLGWKPRITFGKALLKTYRSLSNQVWIPYMIPAYQGKLKRIQELEMQILQELHRICTKHDIRYFLVCGSALGAIRHNGFIPWDDDLDIGMLREDHDKFREVVENELEPIYSFQSHVSDKASHYIFDKIRIKNTKFSTKYSHHHSNEQGIFLDIFVYDRTSNIKLLQKIHLRLLLALKGLIKFRWKIEQKDGRRGYRTLLKYYLMSLLPFSFYHWLYEKILRIFKTNAKARYLIDGVGMNLGKGPFELDLMSEFVNVKFENMLVPVPKNYDGYLTRWFGEDYHTPPPISKRLSGHSIVELDLGDYLISPSDS